MSEVNERDAIIVLVTQPGHQPQILETKGFNGAIAGVLNLVETTLGTKDTLELRAKVYLARVRDHDILSKLKLAQIDIEVEDADKFAHVPMEAAEPELSLAPPDEPLVSLS